MIQRFLILILTALATATSFTEAQTPTVVLRDTFEDDVIGAAPGSPEIGTVHYVGAGSHVVVGDLTGQALWSTDSLSNDNMRIVWQPTASPAVFEVRYDFKMISGNAGTGTLLTLHDLVLNRSSGFTTLSLKWLQGGIQEVEGNNSPIPWQQGINYRMILRVDCLDDSYEMWANDSAVVPRTALGFNCISLANFEILSTVSSTVSFEVDEVEIIEGSSVFQDGFEGGNLSKWSDTTASIPNDGNFCLSAIPFPETGNLLGDLSDNTSTGFSDSCGTNNTVDEWFSYRATCTGDLTVTSCHPASTFDTILSAWIGCAGQDIACNDDDPQATQPCELGGSNRLSVLTFPVTEGSLYQFRVSAYQDNLNNGAVELSVSCQ